MRALSRGNSEVVEDRSCLIHSDSILIKVVSLEDVVVAKADVVQVTSRRRSEHWVAVKVGAEVTMHENVSPVHENGTIYIPIGSVHRLVSPVRIPFEVIEVQVGSDTNEDDIIWVEGISGR